MYYYKKISFCEVFDSVTWNGVKKVAMIWPRKYKRGQLKKHVFFPTSMCSALISFLIRSSLFYPPLPTYSILLNSSVCNSCIFQGWKRTLIKAFFQPIRKIEIFHTRCFFLINEIRLLGDHPLATGEQGLGTPLLRSFTLFCRLRWTFKVSRQISYWVDSAPIPWGMATFCSNSPIYYIV